MKRKFFFECVGMAACACLVILGLSVVMGFAKTKAEGGDILEQTRVGVTIEKQTKNGQTFYVLYQGNSAVTMVR